MKKLRLLIAKWALKPKNITLHDLAEATGIDMKQIIADEIHKLNHDTMNSAADILQKAIDDMKAKASQLEKPDFYK